MESFFTGDGGEPLFQEQIDKRNKEIAQENKDRANKWTKDFIATFCSTPEGRRVFYFLMHDTGVFSNCHDNNSNIYRSAGRREVGVLIMDLLGIEKTLETIKVARAERVRDIHKKATPQPSI